MISLQEIRNLEQVYIDGPICPAQDNFMMLKCLMKSISKERKQNIDLEETIYSGKLFLRQSSVIKDNHQRESFRHKRNYSEHQEYAKQLGYLHYNSWMRYYSLQWICSITD
jgi:hypothetical protein